VDPRLQEARHTRQAIPLLKSQSSQTHDQERWRSLHASLWFIQHASSADRALSLITLLWASTVDDSSHAASSRLGLTSSTHARGTQEGGATSWSSLKTRARQVGSSSSSLSITRLLSRSPTLHPRTISYIFYSPPRPVLRGLDTMARLDRRSLLLLYNLTCLGSPPLCTSVLRSPGPRPIRFKIHRF
jgi:hypothetical protein